MQEEKSLRKYHKAIKNLDCMHNAFKALFSHGSVESTIDEGLIPHGTQEETPCTEGLDTSTYIARMYNVFLSGITSREKREQQKYNDQLTKWKKKLSRFLQRKSTALHPNVAPLSSLE